MRRSSGRLAAMGLRSTPTGAGTPSPTIWPTTSAGYATNWPPPRPCIQWWIRSWATRKPRSATPWPRSRG